MNSVHDRHEDEELSPFRASAPVAAAWREQWGQRFDPLWLRATVIDSAASVILTEGGPSSWIWGIMKESFEKDNLKSLAEDVRTKPPQKQMAALISQTLFDCGDSYAQSPMFPDGACSELGDPPVGTPDEVPRWLVLGLRRYVVYKSQRKKRILCKLQGDEDHGDDEIAFIWLVFRESRIYSE